MEKLLRDRERMLRCELLIAAAIIGLLISAGLFFHPNFELISISRSEVRPLPKVRYIQNAKIRIKHRTSQARLEEI